MWRLGALLALLAAGCAPLREAAPRFSSGRLCAQRDEVPVARPAASLRAVSVQRLAAAGFPRPAIEVAEAIEATDALLRLVELERTPRGETALLAARLRVSEIIMLSMLDLASTLAEIDCEGERGDQLQNRLQAAQDRLARRLGVAGILVGAGTAAATGGLSLAGAATAGSIAGIVGGAAEAGVGAALLMGSADATLRTPRNLLREVWEQPATPRLLPPSVWRYLTLSDGTAPRRLDLLLSEWRGPDILGEPGSQTERERAPLLLGEGGVYDVSLLGVRGSMFDLLEASVGLMHQDLRLLLGVLARRPG
jgi:hypothetical protein